MVEKVKITYKGKSRNVPETYIKGLKGAERQAQIKSIFEGKPRPKTSVKSKTSSWTTKFNKKYGEQLDKLGRRTPKNISKVTGIPEGAIKEVLKKGKGAFYSSGSRPNQSANSWSYARLYSYILGGGARKVDKEITKKYNVKFR